MERVTGIGGVFFKARSPKELQAWYERHLGFVPDADGFVSFKWREDPAAADALTVWSAFPASTKYFDPGTQPFMINYRVATLDAMLGQLEAAGVEIDPKREDSELGRFAWAMDPEGNRFELCEPPAKSP